MDVTLSVQFWFETFTLLVIFPFLLRLFPDNSCRAGASSQKAYALSYSAVISIHAQALYY